MRRVRQAHLLRPFVRIRLYALALLALLAAPARGDTVLTVFAQQYTPETTTGDNPHRLHEFTRLALAFEAMHPGVRVRFIKNPVGEYRTWMRTQLQGGMAPDIMWAHADWTNEDAKYGWFVNLDPYLSRPNRYVPAEWWRRGPPGSAGFQPAPDMRAGSPRSQEDGAQRWINLFYKDATDARRAPDGHLYALPIDQVETAIYYNRDLFERAGVRAPRTWVEFMEVQQGLKAAGITPFLMTGAQPMRLSWARTILSDQLWADRLSGMDVRSLKFGGFPGVDPQEFVRACRLGIFSVRDPRYREFLRLVKEWSQYWQPGYLAAGAFNDQGDRLFRLGRIAMWWDGSWYVTQIDRDPLRKFRYGIFLVPPLTKASSPYAGGPGARGVGGATSIQYAITNSAVRGEKVELAVDFLRFITAPQNLGPLVREARMFVPNVVGLEGHPLQKPFMEVLKAGHARFSGDALDQRYYDRWFRVLQGFLGGSLSEEQALARLEAFVPDGLEQLSRDNAATWRWGPGWTILAPAGAEAEAQGDGVRSSRLQPASSRSTRAEARAALKGTRELFAGAVAALIVLLGWALRRPAARRYGTSYLFLLPTFVLLGLFSYYPIGSALAHAFTEWKGSGDATWTGLANFRELFADPVMATASRNILQLLFWGVVITLTVPLAVAELIFALRGERAQYVYRVLFVIPMVVPGVVILLIWGFIYDDQLGLLNQLLRAIGLGGLQRSWLGDPGQALLSLVFIGFPWVGGFALLIYYAGLQNIPTDVLDSARIDGARGLSRFRFIDLPLLVGQIKLLVVLGFIGGLQGFQTQLLLTNGGPGYATMVPGMHLYQNAITFDRMGYACAIGVALFVVILGITYLNLKYLRSGMEQG